VLRLPLQQTLPLPSRPGTHRCRRSHCPQCCHPQVGVMLTFDISFSWGQRGGGEISGCALFGGMDLGFFLDSCYRHRSLLLLIKFSHMVVVVVVCF